MRLNYSISVWNYEGYTDFGTPEDAVADAQGLGYGVEMWAFFKDEQNLYGPENRERLVKMLRDVPSTLHSGHVLDFEGHKTQIDAARDSSSTVLVVHPNHLLLSDVSVVDYGLARDVTAYAKENGVIVALENGYGNAGLEALLGARDAVPDLRFCIDTGHVFVAHDYPFKDYLDRIGDRLGHLHLQDVYLLPGTHQAKSDSHRTPGQCGIPVEDWQYLLSTLKRINYSGAVVLEVRPYNQNEIVRHTVEFLKSISG